VSVEARTRVAAEAYVAALNSGDVDRIASCVTEDFHNEHTSALGVSLRGRAAYRERLPGFLGEFEGLRYVVEDLLVDGDRAALAYTMTFRVRGSGRGSGRGEPVRIRGVFRLRVADGLVAHRVDYWDGAEFERQTAGVEDR
jgi:ketosteroid isomerase-like protein